jgi:hypothetical protein
MSISDLLLSFKPCLRRFGWLVKMCRPPNLIQTERVGQNNSKEFAMSIFTRIKDAIFGKAHAATPPAPAPVAAAPTAPDPNAPISLVNVEAILDEAIKIKGQDLNWRVSIVDLMKLCDLDSSLGARKELATELGYSGDMNDSATMNIWLHRQVMNKLAANGGYVPGDLKD